MSLDPSARWLLSSGICCCCPWTQHATQPRLANLLPTALESVACLQGKGEAPLTEEVDLTKELTRQQYEAIVTAALNTHEQDAGDYLRKVQARMDRYIACPHASTLPQYDTAESSHEFRTCQLALPPTRQPHSQMSSKGWSFPVTAPQDHAMPCHAKLVEAPLVNAWQSLKAFLKFYIDHELSKTQCIWATSATIGI